MPAFYQFKGRQPGTGVLIQMNIHISSMFFINLFSNLHLARRKMERQKYDVREGGGGSWEATVRIRNKNYLQLPRNKKRIF